MTPESVRVGHIAERCTVLGPGARAVVWVQGCARQCPGCVAPELWDAAGGDEWSPGALAEWFLALAGVEGLTLTGGEPMDQAEALAEFVRTVRSRRDTSVLCYSGYTLEELRSRTECAGLLEQTDILIDGPYLRERHTDLLWRGSDNQRVHLLTERHGDLAPRLGEKGNRVEIVVTDDGYYWMGIPPRGFSERLERMLRAGGGKQPDAC